jgi:hypothetical protein
MSFVTNIFWYLSLFFILFEVYQISNRTTFYYNPVDVTKPVKYLSFYFTKICYIIWILMGALYTHLSPYFYIIIALGIFKFVVVWTKKSFIINLYDILSCLSTSFILGFIFLRVLQLL